MPSWALEPQRCASPHSGVTSQVGLCAPGPSPWVPHSDPCTLPFTLSSHEFGFLRRDTRGRPNDIGPSPWDVGQFTDAHGGPSLCASWHYAQERGRGSRPGACRGRMGRAEEAAPPMVKGSKSCQWCHRGGKVFMEGTGFRGGPATLTRHRCGVPDKRELGHPQRERREDTGRRRPSAGKERGLERAAPSDPAPRAA